MKKLTYKRAIRYFGNQTKLAKALGVSRQAVSAWGGDIPKLRKYEIAEKTNGYFTL